MSKMTYSYGVKKNTRKKRMEDSATSSAHENCGQFISKSPSGASRHFENTFKVIEKKRNSSIKRASSLSSILEEPPSSLDIELEVLDRLKELKSGENSTNSSSELIRSLLERKLDEKSDDKETIYFLSKDRNGATTLRMKFINSLNNLSSSIRSGINGNFINSLDVEKFIIIFVMSYFYLSAKN